QNLGRIGSHLAGETATATRETEGVMAGAVGSPKPEGRNPKSRKAGRSPKPEGREPIAKVPDVFAFQGPFPLTPALSLREREKQKPRCDNSKPLPLSDALPVMLPLPKGEGRGEGEQI